MKEKILKGLFFESTGKTIIKFLSIIPAILVPRALGPESYGVYGLLLVGVGSCTLFVKLGTDAGAKRYFSELEGEQLEILFKKFLKHITKIRLLLVFIVSIVVLIFLKQILAFFTIPFYNFLLYFVPTYIALHSFVGVFEIFLQVKFKQKYLNIIQISSDVIRLILVVIFFLTGHLNLATALLVVVLNKLFLLVFYLQKTVQSLKDVSQNLTEEFKNKYEQFKKRFYNYSFWSFINKFSGTVVADQSDYYFLSYFKGSGVVGVYKLATKFVSKVMSFSLPKSALGTMYNSAMVQAYEKHGKKVLNKYFQYKIKLGYLLWMPLSVGGVVLADEMISILYGEAFSKAAPLIIILFIFKLLVLWANSASAILKTLDKAKLLTILSSVSILNIALNLLLIPITGIYGAAVSTFITAFVLGLVTYFFAKKFVYLSIPWFNLGKIFITSIVMGLLVYILKLLLTEYGLNSIIKILFLTIFGAGFYFSVLYYFKIIEREYFKFYVQKVKKKITKYI